MEKDKKKRSRKVAKPVKSPQPRPSDPDKLKKEDDAEDFSGMNLENFKRNLGCG